MFRNSSSLKPQLQKYRKAWSWSIISTDQFSDFYGKHSTRSFYCFFYLLRNMEKFIHLVLLYVSLPISFCSPQLHYSLVARRVPLQIAALVAHGSREKRFWPEIIGYFPGGSHEYGIRFRCYGRCSRWRWVCIKKELRHPLCFLNLVRLPSSDPTCCEKTTDFGGLG